MKTNKENLTQVKIQMHKKKSTLDITRIHKVHIMEHNMTLQLAPLNRITDNGINQLIK